MQLEDITYYIINESIQLANAKQDHNYLMDYKKMLYMLFLIECEYMKQTNIPLFVEDFFLSANGIAIGVDKGHNFDISLSKHIEQRLFIFEDAECNKYTHPTFEIQLDDFTKDIVDRVIQDYGFVSLSILKGLILATLKEKNTYDYKLVSKPKMQSLFKTEVLANNGISRTRELKA